MVTTLPKRPPQLVLDELLRPNWNPSNTVGYDPDVTTSDYLPNGTSLDEVGQTYPSLVVTFSNETAGGESTYNFTTTNGPGRNLNGSLVATARVERGEYTTDSATYSAVDAETLADDIIQEVNRILLNNPTGGTTDLSTVGSFRAADTPNDYDTEPVVFLASTTITYSWIQEP